MTLRNILRTFATPQRGTSAKLITWLCRRAHVDGGVAEEMGITSLIFAYTP
jgi:hypothetical protein